VVRRAKFGFGPPNLVDPCCCRETELGCILRSSSVVGPALYSPRLGCIGEFRVWPSLVSPLALLASCAGTRHLHRRTHGGWRSFSRIWCAALTTAPFTPTMARRYSGRPVARSGEQALLWSRGGVASCGQMSKACEDQPTVEHRWPLPL
jgi:hypothetical protein